MRKYPRGGSPGVSYSCGVEFHTCRSVGPAIVLTAMFRRDIVNRRLTMANKTEDVLCCPAAEPESATELRFLEGAEADEELAKLAKAIGHPARVRIIRMLSRKEARVCSEIVGELPLAQSTVSEHLRILKDAGLVRSSQDGPRVGYCINFDTLRKLKALIAII
jgi:ArsR family transcriptional regulator, arsenate/arsenite/antimonite-responsive transcriptional repressor